MFVALAAEQRRAAQASHLPLTAGTNEAKSIRASLEGKLSASSLLSTASASSQLKPTALSASSLSKQKEVDAQNGKAALNNRLDALAA